MTDFGLVKAAQNSIGSTSRGILGTPPYIAPEVWKGKPSVSPAIDVYSLACVFFEMLTGQVLFGGDNAPEIMTKHFEQLTLPEFWPTGVPEGITVVMDKALARNWRTV